MADTDMNLAEAYPEALEPEPVPSNAGDSTYEDDISALTFSVRSSVYDYKYENGRRYHAFKEGSYWAPNDEPEQDRMYIQSKAIHLASGGLLHHCPLNNPLRIIDMGTGTGQWVVEMGDKYPAAEVMGIDLSPIQPTWVPSNVKFEVDDVDDDWTWPDNHFDLIHEQLLIAGCLTNFRKYFQQVFRCLRPGGWCECVDLICEVKSDHVTIPANSAAKQWADYVAEASLKMGRNMAVEGSQISALMEEVGLVDIKVVPFKIPIGTWPADPVLKEAGANQLIGMLDGVESLSLALFTRVLGWQPDEVEEFLAEAKIDFRKKRSYRYWSGWIVYGRKPGTAAA